MSQFECYHPLRICHNGRCDTVPCGHCVACLSRRRSDWFIRLLSEYDQASTAVFFTLTYDEESVTKDESVSRQDVTNFVRRVKRLSDDIWRQRFFQSPDYSAEHKGRVTEDGELIKYRNPLRYFISSEYCPSTGRPHYHGFFFNIPLEWMGNDFFQKKISDLWSNGFVTTGVPSNARLNYVVKYCLALSDDTHGKVKPFLCCNRNPAIGKLFLSNRMVQYVRENLQETGYLNYKGYLRPLPRYYKDRIFDDDDKEKMRLRNEEREKESFEKEWSYLCNLSFDEKTKYYDNCRLFREREEKMRLKTVKKQSFNYVPGNI